MAEPNPTPSPEDADTPSEAVVVEQPESPAGEPPAPPADPDDRLPALVLGGLVAFLALCVALVLIAYANGPS